MILEVRKINVERTSPRAAKTKRMIVYCCDQCERIYEGKYQKKYLTNRRYHLCSYECIGKSRKTGGVACDYQLSCRDMNLWQSNLKKTVQNRYNVNNVSSLDWVKCKKIETTRLHYGVDNPQQCEEIKRKTIETHASHGRNWISKPEKLFGELLIKEFGQHDIKIQRLLERKWSVDFYIISLDTYVQFDGVYWHGLNRPVEQIKNSNSVRDKAIYEKWLKDRELDSYLRQQNKRLIRITDRLFYTEPSKCLDLIKGTV